MSAARPMVPARLNQGDDVSLQLTWRGVTYDASGLIGDLTITEDYAAGSRTLTLVIEDPTMVALVRSAPGRSTLNGGQGDKP